MTTAAAPRATRRDATENRQALLGAARLVLNRDPDASLEAIAAEAGLSRRAVYGHFPNRDELLREMVTVGVERVAVALAGVRHRDPVIRVALIGARLWHEVEYVRVTTLFAVRGPFQAEVSIALGPLRASLRETVDEGIAAGTMRADIPAESLARLVESAALAVLDEATRTGMDNETGRRLVIVTVLSTVGLGWREADELLSTTPSLLS